MNTATVIGAIAFVFLLGGIVAAAAGVMWIIGIAHAWAEDRARERRYAEEWAATHRRHQYDGRYTTDHPGRPD